MVWLASGQLGKLARHLKGLENISKAKSKKKTDLIFPISISLFLTTHTHTHTLQKFCQVHKLEQEERGKREEEGRRKEKGGPSKLPPTSLASSTSSFLVFLDF